MNTEKRADQMTTYLRGLSATLQDMMLEDAADLIDELMGTVYEAYEKLAVYEAPKGKRKREPVKPVIARMVRPTEEHLRAAESAQSRLPPRPIPGQPNS
jgi:hypothetical protein